MIASVADPSKNLLDTGTLGWLDIHNKADYSVQQSGASVGSGGPVGPNLLSNMSGGLLSNSTKSDHAEGITRSAVSEGSIIIRDNARQQQDIAQLSHDTDNANDRIERIFDKEKEQNRLKAVQLISELGGQAIDIMRTEGDIQGLRSAKAANPEEQAITALRATPAYRDAMQRYGTGSDMQKAAQAVTGALSALATGNLAGAAMNGAMPYLATEIKNRVGEESVTANAMAHAVLGAVTAELNNQSALAGAVGAGGGELAARVIAQQMFPDKDRSQLSESEKQQVSTLSQLAAGLAGALTTSDTAGAITAAQTGKNATENNYLSFDSSREFDKKMTECKAQGDCTAFVSEFNERNEKEREQLEQLCAADPLTCLSGETKWNVEGGISAASRPDWLYGSLDNNEVKDFLLRENNRDLDYINKTTAIKDKLLAFVGEPENVFGLVGAAKTLFTASATKVEKLIGAGLSVGANAGVQVLEGKKRDEFDYVSLLTAGVSGAAGVGKSLNANLQLNVGGAYLNSQVNSENSESAIVGAALGTTVGYAAGSGITRIWEARAIKNHFGMPASKNAMKYSEKKFGPGFLFEQATISPLPVITGQAAGAGLQEFIGNATQKKINIDKGIGND